LESEEGEPIEPDTITDKKPSLKLGSSRALGKSSRTVCRKVSTVLEGSIEEVKESQGAPGDSSRKPGRQMTVKEREKKKTFDKMQEKKKNKQIAEHKKKEREEREEMARKLLEIETIKKQRE
jgi:hypothetical protein